MTFAWLPPELIAAVLTLLPVDELGRMNRVARMFSFNPSPVEQALRLRAPVDVSPPPAGIPEVEWLFWLERRPLLVERLEGRCSAGLSHFAVAKADGSLLTWGDGYEDEPNDRFGDAVGLLGHGPSVLDVEVPTRCLLLGLEPQLRVCSLSCGPEHTLALCEGGEMMSWGCGNDGRLGHAATSSAMQCFPRRIDHTRGTTTLGVIASRTSRWSGCGPYSSSCREQPLAGDQRGWPSLRLGRTLRQRAAQRAPAVRIHSISPPNSLHTAAGLMKFARQLLLLVVHRIVER